MVRLAKTGGELTDRGWRGTFSSALRLLLDDYLMFHHEKVSIPPIFFGNAFVEKESGMGGIQKISPMLFPLCIKGFQEIMGEMIDISYIVFVCRSNSN